jgi:hypothetical protein
MQKPAKNKPAIIMTTIGIDVTQNTSGIPKKMKKIAVESTTSCKVIWKKKQ